MSKPDVHVVTRAEIARVARTLTDAFSDDPFTTWLFPHTRFLDRCVRSWTRQLAVVYVPNQTAYATADLSAAALWSPPEGWRLTIAQQLRLLRSYLRILGPGRLPRAAAGFGVIERAHPPEPHWYLSTLGVAQAHQRRGHGSSLIRPMLERADTERTLAYLETFNPENVAYYERFGFEVTMQDDIPGGPHMWAMARRPAT
jgi:ribosomal protein S18 acetylase RimI-like enzyme